MKALLDTHTLIWFLTDNPSLSPEARQICSDTKNSLAVSAVSFWELAIKS